MALITESYREQQRELHAANASYGTASTYFAPAVAAAIEEFEPKTLLDYGAGKGRLGECLRDALGERCPMIVNYEPSRPEWAASPPPCEMVACIDVLEHIEPECLGDVLDDLRRCVARVGVFTIHTGPAVKKLPDGRNAHLIQKPPNWWLPQLFDRFDVEAFQSINNGLIVVVKRKGAGRE